MKDYDNNIANLRGLFDMFGDMLFTTPLLGTAQKVVETGNKVHFYYLDQAPGEWVPSGYPQLHLVAPPELEYGSLHAFDYLYMFGHGLVDGVPMTLVDTMPDNDKAVSMSIVHAWATFAKTG